MHFEHEIEELSDSELNLALDEERKKFEACYRWLEKAMPAAFFKEVSHEYLLLLIHALISFPLQDNFCSINLKRAALVMCFDEPGADLKILKNFANHGIRNYQCYVSLQPLPFYQEAHYLRIATLYFTSLEKTTQQPYPLELQEKLRAMIQELNPNVNHAEFNSLISNINSSFLSTLPIDRLILALNMFFRAQTRDNCQYEVRYNEDWQTTQMASIQIVLAWRNTPKYNFLYRLAEVIHRYKLVIKEVNATYIDPYSKDSILIMLLDLHGANGKAAWDATDLPDMLRALTTAKYFAAHDLITAKLVSTAIINDNQGNLLRAMAIFIQQALVHVDQNLYTKDRITEDLCRHPELTLQLCKAFNYKFNPAQCDLNKLEHTYATISEDLEKLDTGNEENDKRRRTVLHMGLTFIKYTLKTNFYRLNYTGMSFRLDPKYLDAIPFERTKKFPELPYAIFFIKGMYFFSFHIRFRDLARGGLRTVYLDYPEHTQQESNHIFSECYNLAWTQQLKNKDIPEGGAKGIIFLTPQEYLDAEALIYQSELVDSGIELKEIKSKIDTFRREQKTESLHQAQRSFTESLITIVNCHPDGSLRAKRIVDYWKRPEYLYLGPDENIDSSMISWIASFSSRYGYKPGTSFISSKSGSGVNHKEYGVTSLGVNTYMEAVLEHLKINPHKDRFTIKMSGGPDGDVAGNQILNLARYYPKTAKLVALTDGSGSIYDQEGLQLHILAELFHQGQAIRFYPPELLSEGGFLLDKFAKRSQTIFTQKTLCWKKQKNTLIEAWLTSSEMNHILRHNVHSTYADIFIPAGGRPRTLNEGNVKEYFDLLGKPSSRAIIEGANLYLTPKARRILEKAGVLIIQDSSANKGGVICSSFEVLCGLSLGDTLFLAHKEVLVQEILLRIQECARKEAHLLLHTHQETGEFLTEISARISEKINLYTDQILDYLEPLALDNDPHNPLIQTLLDYCLPSLREHYKEAILKEIPAHHKKAIIACHIAANLVYQRGAAWQPTIIEILPLLLPKR